MPRIDTQELAEELIKEIQSGTLYKVIAERHNLSLSAVKSFIHRCRLAGVDLPQRPPGRINYKRLRSKYGQR
jgi:transposase